MSYPKWLYSASGAVMVPDAAAHEALEGAWVESPALVGIAIATLEAEQTPEPEKRKPGRPKKVE